MLRRQLHEELVRAFDVARIVILNGARQVGKSTLARQLAQERGGRYLTLDDPAIAGLADGDLTALLSADSQFAVVDEAQTAPALLAALDNEIGRDGIPGRLLLTGSSKMPLADRDRPAAVRVFTLEPLSQAEIHGTGHNLVDALFARDRWTPRRVPTDRLDVVERLCASGLPEARECRDATERAAWLGSYVADVLQRDGREIARVESMHDLFRVVTLLAARCGALLNMAEVSRAAGVPHSTLRRYLSLLEALFIVRLLPAWGPDADKRLVKAPKVHLLDAALAAHLQGHDDPTALALSSHLAPLLETFVVQEMRSHLSWSATHASAWHYRTVSGREVDLVLEADDGRLVAVEVRSATAVTADDFAGLRHFAGGARERFVRGIVFYAGSQLTPFDERLWAVPLGALWAQ